MEVVPPPWLTEVFITAHRSNLIRKDANHYQKFWPTLDGSLEYIWPVGRSMKVLSMSQFYMDDGLLQMSLEEASKTFNDISRVREVSGDDNPTVGSVWYRERSLNGKLVLYKTNFDSSD